MIWLLDTNIVSLLMREDAGIARWLSSVTAGDRLAVCPVIRGEILFGIARLAQGQRRRELEMKARQLFAALPCEPVPASAGDHYAELKLAQQRHGLSLDENDLWIAATALAIGATLVSRDKDFGRIETLPLLTP